jgi:hypothetical protein
LRGGAGAARVSRAPPGPPPFEMFSRAAGRRAEECATAEAERAPGPTGCEGREWSRRRADARRRAWVCLRARRRTGRRRGAHACRPDAPRRRRTEFPSEQFRTLPRGGASASPPERYAARRGRQWPRTRTRTPPRRPRRRASHDPFARNTSRREAPAGAAARRGAPALMRACLSTDRADAAPPYGAARAAHHTQETVSHRCRKR